MKAEDTQASGAGRNHTGLTILSLILSLSGAAFFISGCAPGITRIGYQLPPGTTPADLPEHPIAIRCDWKYDTNDVTILGSIHAYDTGFSVHCDEATILDIFRREGSILDADVIDITEEHEPNPLTSTCYRARATFLRFKDRAKSINLVSDPKYAPDEIAKRAAAAHERNEKAVAGAMIGGAVGGAIGGVLGATIASGMTDNTNYTKVASPKNAGK